jgi:stalled ribosome rescue protein Dom34
MERKTIQSRHTDHHTHQFDSIDHKNQEWHFFQEVATNLADADRLLILGPGVAKHHFRSYLVEHLPALAKKLVGCETVDHPTDNQIAAFAQKFLNMNLSHLTKVSGSS